MNWEELDSIPKYQKVFGPTGKKTRSNLGSNSFLAIGAGRASKRLSKQPVCLQQKNLYKKWEFKVKGCRA